MNNYLTREDDQENSPLMKSPQERKLSYRRLIDKVEELEKTGDTGLTAAGELREVVHEANRLDSECKIESRIAHSDETLLDCIVISSASTLMKKCVENVDVFTDTYEQTEFSANIRAYIKDENTDEVMDNDILKLLSDAQALIPQVPNYNYVYGSYNLDQIPQPKPRKERQKVERRKQQQQKKVPEKIINADKEEEGIEEIVKVLYEVLSVKWNENNGQPIKYYDYVIDTDSFSNTLENMFYFAFLVRDGKAQIDLSSKGEPIIKPMRNKTLTEFRQNGGVNAQIITVISMEQWRRFENPGYLQQHRKECFS